MKTPTSEEIRNWLRSNVSKELKTTPEQITLDDEFTNLGLSSRQAIKITTNLEDFVGKPISAALMWEYPTIRKLAEHLSE